MDSAVGHHIKNLPYIFVEGSSKNKWKECKRYYIVTRKTVVYDLEFNSFILESVQNNKKDYFLIKFRKECESVARYFLACNFPYVDKEVRVNGLVVEPSSFQETLVDQVIDDAMHSGKSFQMKLTIDRMACSHRTLQSFTLQEYAKNLSAQVSKNYYFTHVDFLSFFRKGVDTTNEFRNFLMKLKPKPLLHAERSEKKAQEIITSIPENYITPSSRVLDFGAGDGQVISSLSKFSKLQKENVFAVDLKKIPNSQYFTSLSSLNTIEDHSIDLILLFEVLHHIPHNQHAPIMAELKRCLRIGGVLLVKEHEFIKDQCYLDFMNLIHEMWYTYKSESRDEMYPIFSSYEYLSNLVGLTCLKINTWDRFNYQRIFKMCFRDEDYVLVNFPYDKVYKILSDKSYYSLGLNFVSKKLDIPTHVLRDYKERISQEMMRKYGDSYNVFTFKDTEYIGLQSRKIQYDSDAKEGVNWVEDKIKEGYYD